MEDHLFLKKMNNIMEFLTLISSEKIIFWFFQIIFIIIFVYSVIIENFNKSSGRTVGRGKESQYALYYIYGMLSVILLQIISSSIEIKKNTTFFILLNIIILTYLCFFNSWSRNKIIGIYSKFKNKIEQL